MPKVKSEKRSVAHAAEGEAKKGSGWSGGHLFGSETTETTFQGAGFKDKEKALETIRLLEGRDISFQFQIINSMYHRAKVILKRTKDAEKVQNLTAAVETFEVWLNDYRAHSRAKENFTYLPLDIVEGYDKLAERYGLKHPENGTPSFLQVYKAAEGDLKKLRVLKVDGDDESSVTWDVQRNNNLKSVSERIRAEHLPLYETDLEYRGLPSKEHVEMIMWGYSPEPTKVKKAMAQIGEKLSSPCPVAEPVTDEVDNMEFIDDVLTKKDDTTVTDKVDDAVTEKADDAVTNKVNDAVTKAGDAANKMVTDNGTNSDSD